MTRIIIITSILIFAVIPALSENNEIPYVLVNGTATIQVTPDLMIWQIKITTQDDVLEKAAKQNATTTKRIIQLLLDSGVAEKDMQTANVTFQENWEYKNNSRIKNGFLAITLIEFKLTDLQKYEELYIQLSKHSAVSIDYTQFDYSKRIDSQNEARQKAVLAAKEKAESLAKTLGSTIAEPLSIVEDLWTQEYRGRELTSNTLTIQGTGNDEISGSLAIGKISIQARVKVSFKLTSAKGN